VESDAAPGRPWLRAALRVLVSAALLALVLRNIDASRLLAQLRAASPALLGAGLLILALQVPLNAWRWRTLLGALGARRPEFVRLWAITGLALLGDQFMPATVGADLVRVGTVSRRVGFEFALRSVFADRVLGFGVLGLLAALGAAALASLGRGFAALLVPLAVAAGLAAAIGLWAFGGRRIGRFQGAGDAVKRTLGDLWRLLTGDSALLVGAQSVAIHFSTIAAIGCAALAVGVTWPTLGWLLLVAPSVVLVAVLRSCRSPWAAGACGRAP
jgi:hypothetical protein